MDLSGKKEDGVGGWGLCLDSFIWCVGLRMASVCFCQRGWVGGVGGGVLEKIRRGVGGVVGSGVRGVGVVFCQVERVLLEEVQV